MSLPIYTLDIETDPFVYGRVPKSFAIGFYDGSSFTYFWGKDHLEKMRRFVEKQKPGIIYIHNGGKFDVVGYLMDWVLAKESDIKLYYNKKAAKWVDISPMRIINRRIVKADMKCVTGKHEIRDSYAIIPIPLKMYKGKTQKKEIDIKKLEKKVREKHKAEIVEYLKYDCESLHELCEGFIRKYGLQLTVGVTAMKELKKLHDFETLDSETDKEIRHKYFFGGRVECFETGVIKGNWKVYDVNSMYPYVMKHFEHPLGEPYLEGTEITENTVFLTVEGRNRGALVSVDKQGKLDFNVDYGVFHTTIHEYLVALRYDLFHCDRVLATVDFDDRGSFGEFVDRFYGARLDAKERGDELDVQLCKLILNSCYGKFGQSPENYEDTVITEKDVRMVEPWVPTIGEKYIMWSAPSIDAARFNVATGASITGAARAVLLEAIATAKRPIYCDTDSLICEKMPLAIHDTKKLGAWKLEASANVACIGRRKTYALFDGDDNCVKMASKGVKITADEIRRVAMGETIEYKNIAPSFKLDGSVSFIKRRISK